MFEKSDVGIWMKSDNCTSLDPKDCGLWMIKTKNGFDKNDKNLVVSCSKIFVKHISSINIQLLNKLLLILYSIKFMLLYLTVLRSTKGPDAAVSLSVNNTKKPGNTFNLTVSLSFKNDIFYKIVFINNL